VIDSADITGQVRAIASDPIQEATAAALREAQMVVENCRAWRRHMHLGEDPQRSRILVVDDDARVAQTIARRVQDLVDGVDVAGGVETAWRLARERYYSVVIADYDLLNGTARELITNIRRRSRRPMVNVILISGYLIDRSGEEMARSVGAKYWMPKPIDFEYLNDCIHQELAALHQRAR